MKKVIPIPDFMVAANDPDLYEVKRMLKEGYNSNTLDFSPRTCVWEYYGLINNVGACRDVIDSIPLITGAEAIKLLNPEAEFQYGQEVEYNGNLIKEYKGKLARYIAKSPTSFADTIIIEVEVNPGHHDLAYCSLSDIRPVQSMRDKVKELLDQMIPITNEDLADRIIELVKNEKG